MSRLRLLAALTVFALMFATATFMEAAAKSGSKGGSTKTPRIKEHKRKDSTKSKPTSRASHSATTGRDPRGRIRRSEQAKHAFEVQTGYPHGRPGYLVDHIIPLACGGADSPSNMQWQTVAAAKAKDKVERQGCR